MTRVQGGATRGDDRRRVGQVLQRLSAEDAVMRRTDSGDYRVITPSVDQGPVMPRATAEALRARGLLRTRPGGYGELELSEAGRAFLRRLSSPDEPFRAQHQVRGERLVDPEHGVVPVNAGETPLGWLARRRDRGGRPYLTGEEVEAGERLRTDFTHAQLSPRITQTWAAPIGSGPSGYRPEAEPRDSQLAAKERFLRALEAVGPGLSDVLVAVCCHLQGLEEAERGLSWPVRSGKVVLKIALQRLAAHYGFAPAQGRGHPRSWRAET